MNDTQKLEEIKEAVIRLIDENNKLNEDNKQLNNIIDSDAKHFKDAYKEIDNLKEELDTYKTAQIGHDKIIMDYPFIKQKLDKIERFVSNTNTALNTPFKRVPHTKDIFVELIQIIKEKP